MAKREAKGTSTGVQRKEEREKEGGLTLSATLAENPATAHHHHIGTELLPYLTPGAPDLPLPPPDVFFAASCLTCRQVEWWRRCSFIFMDKPTTLLEGCEHGGTCIATPEYEAWQAAGRRRLALSDATLAL